MKQKPKVFQNPISKELHNNSSYSVTRSDEVYNSKDIHEKIRNIFSDKDYIYKADVIIKLHNETLEKQIIGIKDENLLTIENELIPINDIIDIKRKN